MKASGDREIGRSGDRKNKRTAGTRRRGEETSKHLTTETRRHGESCESSDFPDHLITRNHPITRDHSAPALFRTLIQTLRATLREIFDESAYDRFLLRTHASRSVASYRAFTRERDAAMVKKPRCC
jgi:hypothetical protein